MRALDISSTNAGVVQALNPHSEALHSLRKTSSTSHETVSQLSAIVDELPYLANRGHMSTKYIYLG